MEVALQQNTDFLDMAVKLEQEEKPCGLHQEESHTSPGTSSGFSDITVKLEEEEEEEKPFGLHQQESVTFPRAHSGFYGVTVKLEKDEKLDDLRQQKSEIFPRTSLGFPDNGVKEEEEGESYHLGSEDSGSIAGGQPAMAEAQSSRQRKGGRGISWGHQETLDLIALWGEEKVQEQLRKCHRNIDLFEKIASDMRVKGHDRTAEECRTKSKALRQRYREVVDHNSRSSNGAGTMPFFQELHQILGKDATIHPKRVARSTNVHRAPVGQVAAVAQVFSPPPPEEGSQDPFQSESGSEVLDGEEGAVTTPYAPEPKHETSAESSNVPAEKTSEKVMESDYKLLWSSRETDNVAASSNPKATMTPAERLAQHKRRKERKTTVDPTERLIQHSTRQMNRLMGHLEKEGKESLELRLREEEARRREEERLKMEDELARRDRERLTACIEQQTGLLATLVQHIITTQGSEEKSGVKRFPKQGQGVPNDGDDVQEGTQEGREELPGTSASLAPQATTPAAGKSKVARKLKRRSPYSP